MISKIAIKDHVATVYERKESNKILYQVHEGKIAFTCKIYHWNFSAGLLLREEFGLETC